MLFYRLKHHGLKKVAENIVLRLPPATLAAAV